MSFYRDWHWLKNHPMFCNDFLGGLDVLVVHVDPKTRRIEDDTKRNTATEVWLEHGPVRRGNAFPYTHDPDLDCGGATFEEAIQKLAKRVRSKYGDGKRQK